MLLEKLDNRIIAKGKTVHPFVNNDFKIVNLKKAKPEMWAKIEVLNRM